MKESGEAHQFLSTEGLNAATYDTRTKFEGALFDGEVKFFVRRTKKLKGPVLELGSGTGRVTWPVAEAGARITGLEISEAMIKRAEAKRKDYPEEVQKRATFVRGDMVEFQLDTKFAMTIIPYRAFQCLTTPEDQRKSLRCIHQHLEPGGRLIVDIFDPKLEWCLEKEHKAPLARESCVNPETGNTVHVQVVRRINDAWAQTLNELWRFTEVDSAGNKVREEEEVLALKWTYRQEMRYLFEICGFDVEAEFSDFKGTFPTYGNEQVWICRRK
jgi:SAM-dependent methyltransferase